MEIIIIVAFGILAIGVIGAAMLIEEREEDDK